MQTDGHTHPRGRRAVARCSRPDPETRIAPRQHRAQLKGRTRCLSRSTMRLTAFRSRILARELAVDRVVRRRRGAPMNPSWEELWLELREALLRQPPRDASSETPCVLTLGHDVANDILRVGEDGIVVRSERTGRADFIEARRFRVWWDHLQVCGSASLMPGDANNPHRWRSRLVGAIWRGACRSGSSGTKPNRTSFASSVR